jgi:hypothetical protein
MDEFVCGDVAGLGTRSNRVTISGKSILTIGESCSQFYQAKEIC